MPQTDRRAGMGVCQEAFLSCRFSGTGGTEKSENIKKILTNISKE